MNYESVNLTRTQTLVLILILDDHDTRFSCRLFINQLIELLSTLIIASSLLYLSMQQNSPKIHFFVLFLAVDD